MYDIEFRTDPWTQERKERLYHRRQNPRQNRIRRCCSLAVFLAAFTLGLWAVGMLPLPMYLSDGIQSIGMFYMTILLLCITVCVAALLVFFNAIGQLFSHMPGTKLDYDGPFARDNYRISFDDAGFTVWENGTKSRYKYLDMHRIYKDKQGLLLADIDLYIPMEAIKKADRRPLLKKLYR